EVVAEDRRRMAFRAAGLAEEKRLAAKLLLRRELGIETAERVELRSRREIEDFLELGHRMHLAAALQEVHALFLRDHDVAVEVRRALLELGEILDRTQCTLRSKQPLLRNAAQRRRVDASAHFLRSDVSDEVRGCVSVAVRVTVEAGHAEMGPLTAPVVRHVELLLRERRHEQAQALELLRVEDAVEELKEVLRRDELPLRDVAELGPRREVDRGRELGQEMLGE